MTNIELGDVSQQIYEPGNLVLGDSASLVRIACKRVADSSLVIEVPDDPAHAMRPGRAQMSEFRFHMHCIRNKVARFVERSEEHTSELQSLMRISYAVFCLKKKKSTQNEYKIN